MSLTIALDTASGRYSVALAEAGAVLAHQVVNRTDVDDIGEVVQRVLNEAGRKLTEVARLAVNTGPGNLSSVRNGVAYVNGLAFSLGIPVVAVNSLRLLAYATGQPRVLSVRHAGAGMIYAGLFIDAEPVALRFGRRDELLPALMTEPMAFAGDFQDELAREADSKSVANKDSAANKNGEANKNGGANKATGVVDTDATVLCRLLAATPIPPEPNHLASPLTETSREFDV